MIKRPVSPAAGAVILLAAGYLVFTGRHLLVTLGFPWPLSYPEGVLSTWTARLDASGGLYPAPGPEPPFLHNPWPPVFYWLAAPLMRLGAGALSAPRLVSTLAWAACTALVAVLAGIRRPADRGWALGAAALFAFSPLALRAAAAARVDMAGLAFSLAALAAARGARGPGRWAAAGFLCALALLTKPTFVAAPLACLFSAPAAGRLRAGAFTAALALSAALLLAAARSAWGPGLGAHLVELNRLPLDWSNARAAAGLFLPAHLLTVAALALFLWRNKGRGAVLERYAALSLLGFVFAARTGAEENYFLELAAVGALAAGRLAAAFPAAGRPAAAWALVAQLLLYLPLQPAPVFTRTYGQELAGAGLPRLTPRAADRAAGDSLVAVLRAVRDPVLCQDVGYLPPAGRAVVFQPYQFTQRHRAGLWDDAPVVAMIRAREFDLVVLRFDPETETSAYFTPGMVAAIRDNYYHLRHIGPWHVLEPR